MTSTSPVSTLPRQAGTWISLAGVTAYVLASPLLLGGSLAGTLWWVAAGAVAVGIVAAGAFRSARAAREHLDELIHDGLHLRRTSEFRLFLTMHTPHRGG